MKIHVIDLLFLGIEDAIAAFLVESEEGLILVETGPNSCYDTLKMEVSKIGYDITDIKHVFLTHIHLDHAGSAWELAAHGAKVYVHPIGYPHILDPSRLMSSAKRIYKDQLDRLWGRMEAIPEPLLIQVEDQQVIKIGNLAFKAWYTPGHAPHHIAWQLGEHLFAGDVAGVQIGSGMVTPPCPPPDIDIEAWMESIRIMRSLKLSTIYITHFGSITNIEQHLDGLEFILKDWSEWVRPYFEKEADPNEVVPLFVEYTNKQLVDNGIDQADILKYANANPAGLSVFGLMRYWKKKLSS